MHFPGLKMGAIALAVATLSPGQTKSPRRVADDPQSNDAYQIYSLVAARTARHSISKLPQRYASEELTSAEKPNNKPIAQCFPPAYGKAFASAFEDYTGANMGRLHLTQRFTLPQPVDLVPAETIVRIDQNPLREEFFKAYPKSSGLFTFSIVGFSRDKTRAVVSVKFWCGMLCALDTDYLLKKVNGKWQILPVSSSCGGIA